MIEKRIVVVKEAKFIPTPPGIELVVEDAKGKFGTKMDADLFTYEGKPFAYASRQVVARELGKTAKLLIGKTITVGFEDPLSLPNSQKIVTLK